MYVFVAAIASSGPAARSMTWSAAAASGLAGSLVMASVGAPWRAAAAMTATMSGDAPDWLIPIDERVADVRLGAVDRDDRRRRQPDGQPVPDAEQVLRVDRGVVARCRGPR